MIRLVLSLLLLVLAPSLTWAATWNASNCDQSTIINIHNQAADGDTIQLPAMSCTWTGEMTINKAVTLTGAGSAPSVGAATVGGTTITLNGPGSVNSYLAANESPNGNVVITNLTVVTNVGFTAPVYGNFTTGTAYQSTGKPVIYHHNTFLLHGGNNSLKFFWPRGVVYRNRFEGDQTGNLVPWTAVGCQQSAIDIWQQTVKAGAADTNGTNNLYFETNSIKYVQQSDTSDGCRIVIRYNTFENATWGSHGQETAVFGMRWMEVYNNTFRCTAQSNVQTWVFYRGGTGVITDNVADDITSTCAAAPLQDPWYATMVGIRRGTCWIQSVNGYPYPRQPGWGYTTGATAVDASIICPTCQPQPERQNLEPIYIWGNTKPGGASQDSFALKEADGTCNNTSTPDSITRYMQQNREYYIGVAKPGYTKYTYPHPLALQGNQVSAPSGLNVR